MDHVPPATEFGPLAGDARRILDILLAAAFPGRDEIVDQVAVAKAKRLDEHGCLALQASDAAPADVRARIPVEAEVSDADGVPIHVLLHVVDGYIDELEFFREDGGELRAAVRPEGMRVIVA